MYKHTVVSIIVLLFSSLVFSQKQQPLVPQELQGNWWDRDRGVVLAIRDDALFVLGGGHKTRCNIESIKLPKSGGFIIRLLSSSDIIITCDKQSTDKSQLETETVAPSGYRKTYRIGPPDHLGYFQVEHSMYLSTGLDGVESRFVFGLGEFSK